MTPQKAGAKLAGQMAYSTSMGTCIEKNWLDQIMKVCKRKTEKCGTGTIIYQKERMNFDGSRV